MPTQFYAEKTIFIFNFRQQYVETSEDVTASQCHIRGVNNTSTVRDLGLIIEQNLKFRKHISHIVRKAHANDDLILVLANENVSFTLEITSLRFLAFQKAGKTH
jgi:hypothetical protein